MPYYCGCWGSAGRFSLAGLFDDVRASFSLLSRYRHVDPARVGVLGYSLGGWAALRLASQTPVAAAAVIAPAVPHGDEVGDARYLRRYAKAVNIPRLDDAWRGYLATARKDRPEAYLPRISPTPLLFVQGLRDALVPSTLTSELWALADYPKKLIEFPEEDHQFQQDRPAVISAVCGWLEASLGDRTAPKTREVQWT
jgi:dipeptidyl aminopeptidase/acylaminoacyl peptidase